MNFLMVLGIQALGYVGGTFYSLSYIRKAAAIKDATACVKPSIITFVVLAVFSFGLTVFSLFAAKPQGVHPAVGIVALLAYYAVICFAFGEITRRGFAQMEPQSPGDGSAER